MEATPFFGRYQTKDEEGDSLFKDTLETPQKTPFPASKTFKKSIFSEEIENDAPDAESARAGKPAGTSLFALLPSPPTKLVPAASNVTLVDQDSSQNVFSLRKAQSPVAVSSPTSSPEKVKPTQSAETFAESEVPLPLPTLGGNDQSNSQANTSGLSSKSKSGKALGLRQQSAIIDHLKKENFSLRMRILHLESEIDGKDPSSVSELQVQYNELKLYMERVEKEFANAHKELRESQTEGDQLRAELANAQAELLALQDSKAHLERERDVLQQQQSSANEQQQTIQRHQKATVDSLNSEITTLSHTVDSLRKSLAEFDRVKSANIELESQLQETRVQLDSSRAEFEAKLKEQRAQIQEVKQELQRAQHGSSQNVHDLQHELHRKLGEVGELQGALHRQKTESDQLRDELESLKRQYSIVKNENREYGEIIKNYSQREQELLNELESTRGKLDGVVTRSSSTSAPSHASAKLVAQLESLQSERERLETTQKKLEVERDKASTEFEREKLAMQKENLELEKQFFALRDRYEQLKRQLKHHKVETSEKIANAETDVSRFAGSRAVHEREQLLLFTYDHLSKLFGDKFPKLKEIDSSFSKFADKMVDVVGEVSQLRLLFEEKMRAVESKGLSQFQQLNLKMNSRIKQLEKFETIVRAAARYQKRLKETCDKRQRVIVAEKELTQSLSNQVKDLLDQIQKQDELIMAQKRQNEKLGAKSAQQKMALRTAAIRSDNDGHSSARLKEMQIKLELERRGAQERVDELLERIKLLERQLEQHKRNQRPQAANFKQEFDATSAKLGSVQRNYDMLFTKHEQLLKEYKSTHKKLATRDKLIKKALSRLASFNEQKETLEKGLWQQATADLQSVLQHPANHSIDYSVSTTRTPILNGSPGDSSF